MSVPANIGFTFEQDVAKSGGVFQRNVQNSRRDGSEEQWAATARTHGFHMVQIGEQYLFFKDPVRIIC